MVDADLLEAPQPERVAAPAGDALLAALVRPDAVVREDAVEVEDDEPNRAEVAHASRAATGEPRARGRRERRPARPSAAGRACGRSGGRARRAAARRPRATSRPRRPARGRAPRGDPARRRASSPSSAAGRSSLGSRRFTPSPSADGHAVEIPDEPAHPVGHERVRVIGALPGVVEREVLLEHARAEHVRDRRHRDPVVMVREPDHELGVALLQRRDHREVEILDLGRVRGRAVEDAELAC